MKKLVSLLIMLSIFAISCMNTVMASFVMPDGETSMDMTIEQMDSPMNNCCSQVKQSAKNNNHECCIYPFENSSNIGAISNIENNNEKKIKIKILDYSFLAILNESLEVNYLEKLTSPPGYIGLDIESNTYIDLVGIIKNNC